MNLTLHQKLLNIARGEYHDPHNVLGIHESSPGKRVVRVFVPDANRVSIERLDQKKKTYPLSPLEIDGFWQVEIHSDVFFHYKIHAGYSDGNTYSYIDPYQFMPTISENDLYLFNKGDHRFVYEILGAHPLTHDGILGVRFAVWAPTARRVSVVGDFNRWDGRFHQMREMGSSGVWEIFIPEAREGVLYKYEIYTAARTIRIKTDPYAQYFQIRPENACIVYQSTHQWQDQVWIEKRAKTNVFSSPLNIYEVHVGSWRHKEDGSVYSYRDLARELVPYVKTMGYTHIEFLPIMEHPFDASWGYQVTGYYAPTSRFGIPDDLKYLIDECHQEGIGVILDWVPAHFPKDDFALARFDGTALYEHEDTRLGEHPDWGTYIFNYGRNEVKNFLLANAVYWLKEFHADGLRMDAVASMLYLDYSRKAGEWIPNKYGGNENLEAIEFLKHVNSVIHEYFPDALLIAEESTAWPGVTRPVQDNGLGFTFKWNMGWMNDFLSYMSKDPIFRKYHHNELTFSMLYAYSENYILVLSHDEVVHGKRSLLSKMPGDDWQKFANFKVLLGFMITHPGKKLLFMGSELAPWHEWNENQGVEWHLLQWEPHKNAKIYVEHLNKLYLNEPALWEQDHKPEGFEWIDVNNADQSIISFIRHGKNYQEDLLVMCNFTPETYFEFRVGVNIPGEYQEIFNSDAKIYYGSGVIQNSTHSSVEIPWNGRPHSISFGLSPLSMIIFKRIN
ncbi:MAG: 1,4-alpha-glucan branching protein GlgB [Candidatus Marinimicrobia bacterium]|nr:1,4-alpha-glucan branching protein GlgB [Candidatus Neomarinimicrobiota bacterium]MDD5582560.1 1,4-alpha-glucan branching protein GlgB [Candidatus Neomarinimicrobiota bacterium]